jgi:hypothetical protein
VKKIFLASVLLGTILPLQGCRREQSIEDTVYGIIAANPGKPFRPCDQYYDGVQYEALASLIKKGKVITKGEGLEVVP